MPWTTPTDRATGYTVTAADWNIVEDDLTFLYGDTSWTTVSAFTNSWISASGPVGFILIGRVVYLRGALSSGTAATAAFTLPAGYRPKSIGLAMIVLVSGTTVNALTINSSGTVVPTNSATTRLDGISFPVV